MIVKPVSTACGQMQDNEFLFPVRVYYEDTDAGGVVYYANYLKFAERARTEYVRCLGLNQQEGLEADEKFAFMVRHCEADYMKPAVLDDELIVTCKVIEKTGVTATILQEVRRNNEVLVSLKVKVVYMSLKRMKPSRLPGELI